MERDPVCGMMVDPAQATAKSEHGGRSYYFCCKSCADKFRTGPEGFLRTKMPISAGHHGDVIQLTDISSAPKTSGSIAAITPHAVSGHEPGTRQTQKRSATPSGVYLCPMDPEIQQDHPGACPKCGMALEAAVPNAPVTRTEYTCPMHPEIVRSEPGACPICGMALEPRGAAAEERIQNCSNDPPLLDQPGAHGSGVAARNVQMYPGHTRERFFSMRTTGWIEFLLATPVVLWGGRPFFERGWASLVNRSLNMFTLIALGTGTAYVYSVVAVLFPGIFPASFRAHGEVPVYFEAAAAITTLVLLGQVLELRARSRTSAAIRALAGTVSENSAPRSRGRHRN